MLDSVKNDFSVDFGTNKLGGTRLGDPNVPGVASSDLTGVGQVGRNFTQSLPTSLPDGLESGPATDFINRSAIDLSAGQLADSNLSSPGTSAKQTLARDISQSLKAESNAWQGGLLSKDEAVSVSTSVRRSPGANTLSQQQLNNAVGTFVVGGSGKVTTDYLFDGDSRVGELALFNLDKMGGLSRSQFVKEAAKRALSGGQNGRIIINDRTEGAQFDGSLGEQSRSRGKAAPTKTVSLRSGTRFGVMFVPQGTVAAARAGRAPVQFSIAALNAGGKTQMGKVSGDIFGMESSQFYKGYSDFNDVVFRMKGARGTATNISQLLPSNKNWSKDANQLFNQQPGSQPDPVRKQTPDPVRKPDPTPDPVRKPEPVPVVVKRPDPTPDPVRRPEPTPTPPAASPNLPGVISDISTSVSKFNPGSSEADIIASGAEKIVLGSQRIYIGTQQVSRLNQNPIVRSFDDRNPKNNWTRTDIESTGTDGRGLGLLWTGKSLYGIFSVDGTQGNPSQDFRRAATGATQNWLKSYGPGGGGKISVIGQLDPSTGKLLKAAHLSSVLTSGKTNSLSVTAATVNKAGNIVLTARSAFGPRRPNGSLMTRNPGNTAGSPFTSTIEINKELTKVVRTATKGWS